MARKNPFRVIYNEMVRVDTKRCYELAYGHTPKEGEEPIEFPKELHVELTNKCNLKCGFCPIGKREIKRPVGFMREDLFWAICTEAYEYGAALRLIRWGEPTLHIRCYDYIRMAKSVGLLVHMNTNGVNLDVKQVLSSGLDSIKVSLHHLKAVESIQKLVKLRGKRVKPFITVAQLSSEMATRGKGRVDGPLPTLSVDKFVYAPTRRLHERGHAPKTCYELYNRLSIDWDGQVLACCGAYDRQMRLGHIYDKDTLKEIWDGNALKRYREMEQKGTLNQVPLCDKCVRR